MANPIKLLPLALLTVLTACPAKKEPAPAAASDGGSVSVACSSPEQDRCRELTQPSKEQRAQVTVECGSVSGKLSSPASCPTAGFIGKCTVAGTGNGGPEISRWYKADDAAYQKDFCVSTAKGVWSTAF